MACDVHACPMTHFNMVQLKLNNCSSLILCMTSSGEGGSLFKHICFTSLSLRGYLYTFMGGNSVNIVFVRKMVLLKR